MSEEEIRDFLTRSGKDLPIRMAFIDEKGEPLVTPTGYYFDETKNRIYITTPSSSKKVQSLSNNDIVGFTIDDSTPPFKGVKGKGKAVIHRDIAYNKDIIKKFILRVLGNRNNPAADFVLSQIESGNNVIIEIIPRYFSTWLNAIPKP
jgi:nitroimidazol reductase NimA-like FMN-containing flavoprotein (pyridoxamine 5'-phosphate oxidase superfamily)